MMSPGPPAPNENTPPKRGVLSERWRGSGSEVLRHEVPVHQVPERLDILRTGVAVVDVVGMLPHVTGQQRSVTGGDRIAGADGAYQAQRAVSLLHQPAPAGTEGADGNLAELFLECVEGAECLVDRFCQFTGGLAAAIGAQAVPVEGVVPDLGSVVEQSAAGGLDDLCQALALVVCAGDQVVQVDHIGVVVLAVVIGQGLGGDVRLKSVFGMGKRG